MERNLYQSMYYSHHVTPKFYEVVDTAGHIWYISNDVLKCIDHMCMLLMKYRDETFTWRKVII